MPCSRSRRGSRRGRLRRVATRRCTAAVARSVAGSSASNAAATMPAVEPPLLATRTRRQTARAAAVTAAMGSRYSGRRMPVQEALQPARRPQPGRELLLEIAAARSDQVIADVRVAAVAQPGAGTARRLDALTRDVHLPFAGAVGQRLERLPVTIAARKVHPPIHADRVVVQDRLDLAHRLDEPAPVVRGAEAQAGDGVGHRHLVGGFALPLDANRVFRRHLPPGQPCVQIGRCTVAACGPYSRIRCSSRTTNGKLLLFVERYASECAARIEGGQVGVGTRGIGPGAADALGDLRDVRDQRRLQHARPGPQLADRQRRAPTGTRAGTRVTARHRYGRRCGGWSGRRAPRCGRADRSPSHLDLRQPQVVATRQVVGDASDLVSDEVEVVEEPFGGGRNRLGMPDVVRDGAIGLLEHPRLLAQALQVAGSGPPGTAGVGRW